jgi:hypothetical protein
MTILPGFVGQEDILNDRIANVGVERIDGAVQETLNWYNNQIQGELTALTGVPVTTAQWKVRQVVSRAMQPLDPDGNPVPQQGQEYYTVGVPVMGAGDAYGTNRVTAATMTVMELNNYMAEIMIADKETLQRRMLNAFLFDQAWTWHDIYRPETPDITVYPLANGDGVVYPKNAGGTLSVATDTHYLAQANAIDNNNNPFPTIYEELREHPQNNVGYRGTPTGYVFVYVASNLTASIEALSALVEIPDTFVTPGISTSTADANVYNAKGFGGRVLGIVDGCIVVEWGALPDGYMFARAPLAGNPLSWRELDVPSLRGLFNEMHNVDGNHMVYRFLRWAGFGVTNRTAALCYQIGAGAYAEPAGYDPRING